VVNYNSGKGKKAKGGKSDRFGSLMDLLKVKPKQSGSKKDAGDKDKVKKITLEWLADHLDELTLTDDERLVGRINVNTAPREVLLTLPKMTAMTAEAILRRQSGGEGPFDSVGELLTGKTVTEDQFKAFAERVTVRASVFEIRSRGVTKWGICSRIVAVVDRATQPMSIIYWYQSE